MISARNAVVLVLIATLTYLFTRVARKRPPLPPGPRGLPLVGNILDVPSTYQWIAYEEFGKKYNSPIVHVKILDTDILSVNDYEVARDIFEKRGSLHAGRPRLVTLREICGHSWNFGFRSPDAYWKTCRKVFDSYFKPSEIKKMRPRFTTTVQRQLLKRILEEPSDFTHHCHTYAVIQSLEIAYGLFIEKNNDPFIRIVENCMQAVNGTGNYQLVDAFPWIRFLPGWFPGMAWKAIVPQWQASNRDMSDIPFLAVKKALQDRVSRLSVATDLLSEDSQFNVSEDIIKDTASTIVAATVDTVVSMMQSTFLCMSIFPDAQKAAQEELDRVVGSERLPDFNDEPQLPYVKSVYREVLRWAVVTPLALPHRSMEDDVWSYNGKDYFIRKSTIMLANAWAMTRDSSMYPNPHHFDPGRYLNKDGQLDPDVREPDMPFGFRPRSCPGRWYAEDFLFIFIASVLHAFHIDTEDGKPAKTTQWTDLMRSGLGVYPKPFSCRITPRSQKIVDLIRQPDDQQ